MRASRFELNAKVIALVVLISCAPAMAADDAAASPLDKVAKLIGQWRIEAQWSSGEALKGRQTYEWGLGKKFIVAKTFVTKNDGSGEYQRYETVMAVKDGKLISYNFTYDGTSSVVEMQIEGDTLRSRREIQRDNGAMVIKQELELTAADKSRWKVWIDRDGKEEQVMDGTWVRVAKDAGK
jgi:hypothetical protein